MHGHKSYSTRTYVIVAPRTVELALPVLTITLVDASHYSLHVTLVLSAPLPLLVDLCSLSVVVAAVQ
jgi:hypothetical protein